MGTSMHNRAQFERTIERMITAADHANRGTDLDRVVGHLEKSPTDVSRLASLVMMIDDDVRPELSAAIEAFRRFRASQDDPIDDEAILSVMQAVYRRVRGG